MPVSSLLRVLAASAFLLLPAAPSVAEKVPPPSPSTAGKSVKVEIAKARALMKLRRYDLALAVLRPLVQDPRHRNSVLFLTGIAALEHSQKKGREAKSRDTLLSEAIAYFRTVLIRNPGLVRVRLELARAFFLKGEDDLARRHFLQVLAGKPPAAVALNVNRFLNQIRARKRWSLRVGMALAPDSNIGSSSDERIIFIEGLPFRRNQEELTSSGIGIWAWAGGEYQYPLADRWRLRAGGDFSRREYKKSEFDRMTVAGHVGPRWLIGRASEASLLLSGLHHWTGSGLEEPSHHDIGLRAEARHRFSRRTTATVRASRHERRYDVRTHLDGPVTDISVGASWVATPTLRIDGAVGWGREQPKSQTHRHSRRWVQAGFTTSLPWGFTLGGSGTLRWTDYEGNWFPFTEDGSSRSDLIRNLRLSVYNRSFTLKGVSPQLSLVHEQRTSNAQLHDYERTFVELRFVRLF